MNYFEHPSPFHVPFSAIECESHVVIGIFVLKEERLIASSLYFRPCVNCKGYAEAKIVNLT
jgi:hypothetical protein